MIRWLRIVAIGLVILTLITVGVGVGLFLVANAAWVPVDVPPWLTMFFGDPKKQVWLPVLIAGWLVAILLLAVVLLWSFYYVFRRRQYEALIARLERELARLRNLPFTDPAPLEDLPEAPDPRAARVLADVERDVEHDTGDDDGEAAVG